MLSLIGVDIHTEVYTSHAKGQDHRGQGHRAYYVLWLYWFFTRLLLKIEKKIKPVLLRSVKIVVSSVEIS